MKTALVFSAGGMFGAWQAGAWKVCAEYFQPDLIVGASIGSLNGWLVAGGSTPEELAKYWMEFSGSGPLRMRIPRSPGGGWMDTRQMETAIRELYRSTQPRMDYALVVTDLMRMRPRIFSGGEITESHLLASCALPLIFDQPKIEGRFYSDGGLLAALPVWAAAELGADRILALNAMPHQPSRLVYLAGQAMRKVAPWRPTVADHVEVIRIQPDSALGGFNAMMNWHPDRVREWIRQGEQDAKMQLQQNKTFRSQMF